MGVSSDRIRLKTRSCLPMYSSFAHSYCFRSSSLQMLCADQRYCATVIRAREHNTTGARLARARNTAGRPHCLEMKSVLVMKTLMMICESGVAASQEMQSAVMGLRHSVVSGDPCEMTDRFVVALVR